MIQAVVFDMDGVLIDAREWHFKALNRALELFGMPISEEDHLARFDGLPTRTKLEMLSREKNLPIELHAFINDLKQEYTVDLIQTLCRPTFKQEYALSRLKADGYLTAVASNSIRSTVELMMEKSHLARYLDLQVSASDVSQPKPDPEIYRVTVEHLNLSPAEVLVVEDSQFGIAAAEAAGCHLLKVESPDDVHFDRIQARIHEITGGNLND